MYLIHSLRKFTVVSEVTKNSFQSYTYTKIQYILPAFIRIIHELLRLV
jgi:hypothetical protein